MAKDDQQEAYEKLLSANLARTLDLLKFAEAKNAALLAFAAAWVVASINLLVSGKPLPPGVELAVMVAIPLWGVAALIAMWAFLPKMKRAHFLKETPLQPPSLLFLGDVAKMKAKDFRQQIRDHFYPSKGASATENYLADLTGQIYAVATIADRKFKLFHRGAAAAMGALAVLAIPFVLLLGRWLMCAASVPST